MNEISILKDNKISVIIPMYNAEKTIIRCITSILNTKFQNYEIIIIDDGSTDSSFLLVKEFVEGYDNITVFAQKNRGISAARNKGLELSTGDIITFVDSDDYVNEDYLLKIAKAYEDSKTDIVFFSYQRVTAEGDIVSVHQLPTINDDYYQNLVDLSMNDIFGYAWIKAYKRSVIGDIRFDEDVKLFEDEIFSCKVLKNPVNIKYLNEILYCYVRTNGTLFNQTNQHYCKICNYVWSEWLSLLKNYDKRNEILQHKANHMVKNCKWYVLERNVKILSFYQEFANSNFIKNATVDDWFINAVRKKKWISVFLYHTLYRIKNLLYRAIKSK